MTAVARLAINRYSVLIGDLLISGPERPGEKVPFPTVRNITEIFPEGSGFVPIDLAQKISIIGENLAIGWSGTHFAAKTVIKGLYEKSQQEPFTRYSLDNYFRNVDASIWKMGVGFVGFISDEKGITHFGFNHETLQTHSFGEVGLLGSGSERVQKFLKELSTTSLQPVRGHVTPFAKVILSSLLLTGYFLMLEVATRLSLLEYFGGGYEIATYANGKFRKLDDVTYCFWSARIDGKIVKISEVPRRILKYSYFDDILAIRSAGLRESKDGSEWLITEHKTGLVSPMYRKLAKGEVDLFDIPSMSSEWLFHCFFVTKPAGKREMVFRVDHRSKKNHLVEFREKKEGIEVVINTEFVKEAAKHIYLPYGDTGTSVNN